MHLRKITQKTVNFHYNIVVLAESSLEEVGASVRETTPIQPRQDTGLFTAVTRPESVQKLYQKANTTPRAVYASLGPKGWKAAKKFCLTPVLKHPGETTYTIQKHEVSVYYIDFGKADTVSVKGLRFCLYIIHIRV